MKIDYKNYPILENVYKRNLDGIKAVPGDEIFVESSKSRIRTNWHKHAANFQNIEVLSHPFLKACIDSQEILFKLFNEVSQKEVIPISGTFILHGYVIMIDFERVVDEGAGCMYIFMPSGQLLGVYIHEDGQPDTKTLTWRSSHLSFQSTGQHLSIIMSLLYIVMFFKKYATVETKILKPHQRPREISCLYRNNTKLDVLFLDCKWFTNLVKSEGFNVRGHFRLQPFKEEGKWTKKLIWINEFHKTGYTAPARKLSYTEKS